MDREHKLTKLSMQTVIDVLNSTPTIRDAARELRVSRKAVYDYMRARKIAKHCVYVALNSDRPFARVIKVPVVTDTEGTAQ